MPHKSERYSKLAPLDVHQRIRLGVEAINFFSGINYEKNCEIIGLIPDESCIRPLNGINFLTYLKEIGLFQDPHKYLQRIRFLLEKLSSFGILSEVGAAGAGMKYYSVHHELTKLQREGLVWLAPTLGDDVLYDIIKPGVVQITGQNLKGDIVSGTGIVFADDYILTCAHVVNDVRIDSPQIFNGVKCEIVNVHSHPVDDVAVIQISGDIRSVRGMAFYSPTISQSVHVLGYPKIPYAREAALTIQRGEITSEQITTLDNSLLFLYSAIARPGNSGGPIISDDGYIVGITTQDLSHKDSENPITPHFAGIASHEIKRCISEMKLEVNIPFETFD